MEEENKNGVVSYNARVGLTSSCILFYSSFSTDNAFHSCLPFSLTSLYVFRFAGIEEILMTVYILPPQVLPDSTLRYFRPLPFLLG